MTAELRLFIALELPRDVLDALSGVQADLQRDAPDRTVRWVKPAGIHLTLKFLGETPASQRDAIQAALDEAARGHGPLTLIASRLGCFPNTRRPRVVWVGLEGDQAGLGALQSSVERALEPLGFAPEKRGFSPHLTLGRVRREAYAADVKALGSLIEARSGGVGEVARWTAGGVSLMRSELGRGGARYTCLHHVPLGV
jgi:2'-5' RNA ligase